MIKSLIVSTVLAVSAFALSGQEVYDNKCASCHQMKGMMDMSQMKAPPMNMVSMRIKKTQGSKENFLIFVKDYIVNPSQDKGVCMPMAYKRFGVMPPIGKGMSSQEINLVSLWLYENFKGEWKDSKDGKTCDSNNAKSADKCGAGKCGSDKCGGAGKCGGHSKATKE